MIDSEIFNTLSEVYSRAHLEKGLMPLVKSFLLLPANKGFSKPAVAEVLQKLVDKKSLVKSEMAVFCFAVFENEVIYKAFLQTLSAPLKMLIEKLLWMDSISDEEAGVILKESVTTNSNLGFLSPHRYADENMLRNEFNFFSVQSQKFYGSGAIIFTLSLNSSLKSLLIEYYPKPVYYDFIPLENIPVTTVCYTAENLIQEEIQRVVAYYMQDNIKYSTRGKPTEATLNKFQKTANVNEFYLNEAGIAGKMRSMLIAGLLYNFKVNNISIDTLAIIKTLFGKHYTNCTTSQFILMYLKGWGTLDKYDYDVKAEAEFLMLIKLLPTDNKWISIENLLGFIQTRVIKIKPITGFAINNRLYYDSPATSYENFQYRKSLFGKGYIIVEKPFVMGNIFLFAAFGLLEIAYNYPDFKEFPKTFYSGFDELKYLKLTPLGAYVLGLSEVYEPAAEFQKNTIQLSEDSMIILVDGEMDVMEVLLNKFAEKAGTNRFKVTSANFLKDCNNATDIYKKVDLFKKTIVEKLPLFWELQFTSWQTNALKITEEISTRLYKIPADAKDLHRLIAQDEVLKKLILKGEQFYILVELGNIPKFKNRMKELGYVIG